MFSAKFTHPGGPWKTLIVKPAKQPHGFHAQNFSVQLIFLRTDFDQTSVICRKVAPDLIDPRMRGSVGEVQAID